MQNVTLKVHFVRSFRKFHAFVKIKFGKSCGAMDFENESKKILENMELQRLREEYEAELKKYIIQNHLIDILKRTKVDQLKDIGPESKKNIEKAINSLYMVDYLKMENSGATVLGKCRPPRFPERTKFYQWKFFQVFRRSRLICCTRKKKRSELNWPRICQKRMRQYSVSLKLWIKVSSTRKNWPQN